MRLKSKSIDVPGSGAYNSILNDRLSERRKSPEFKQGSEIRKSEAEKKLHSMNNPGPG